MPAGGRPRTVIVGASVAGYRTAEALVRYNYTGQVVLLGAERYAPYQRPPLSKAFLAGELSTDELALSKASTDLESVQLLLGTSAMSVDPARRVVVLEDEQLIDYSTLVIATGAEAKTLPGGGAVPDGIFTLRTVDDALRLRTALAAEPSVAIIGGGFIGCEVAATCRKLGVDVTIVEAGPGPLLSLGREVSTFVHGLHERHGVDWVLNRRVARLLGEEHVEGLEMDDGAMIAADVVVVGLGVRPATGWLQASGLPIGDGLLCDEVGRVLGTPEVFAVGDVANWTYPLFGQRRRLEHWDNAVLHADVVGAWISGTQSLLAASPLAVPHFWSDQYSEKLQVVGLPSHTDSLHLDEPGSLFRPGERSVGIYSRGDQMTGAVVLNWPARCNRLRSEMYSTLVGATGSQGPYPESLSTNETLEQGREECHRTMMEESR